jgi:sterol desaturase/sphingolipid hydroxylase (fatty acid hydroxylase superfamily)
MKDTEARIRRIEDRNKKVETDKAWETSWTRRLLLILFTYLSIGFYLNAIQIPNAWLNAIVPAVGFLLSTLTLPFFKDLWIKYISKK